MYLFNNFTILFYILLCTTSLKIGVKSLPLVNKNTVSLFWKNIDYNIEKKKYTYILLYLRLVSKLTYNLCIKKNIYFFKYQKKTKQKLHIKKIEIKSKLIGFKYSSFPWQQNSGRETQLRTLNILWAKSLLGQVLNIRLHNTLVTLITIFSYNKRVKQQQKKKKKEKKINLYKVLRLFNNN